MLKFIFPICFSFYFFGGWISGPPVPPDQPAKGPGSSEYVHDSVFFQDYAAEADGYWLFEPVKPAPDSAHVVVFVHGYGGYNPMIYGAWIKHLVRKGNIVIYPRYQKSLFSTHPDKFAANSAVAIKNAIELLESEGHTDPILSKLAFVGHSYGGVVSADLAVNFDKYEIPKPQVAMLCAPGSGKFKGGRLESYEAMPEDLLLLMVSHENDRIVGDEFSKKVFAEATSVQKRNYIQHFADNHGEPTLGADHNQAYALDMDFDNGVRNYTSKKALRVATIDPVDYNGYWKLFDAMLECSRSGNYCNYAFGNSEEQTSLGLWSDGQAIKPFQVSLPE